MIAGDGHRPAYVPFLQLDEKAGGVIDIEVGIEHFGYAGEVAAVIILVDLHAAEVDQFGATAFGVGKDAQRLGPARREHRLAVDVHGVRLKAAFLSGLGKADGIEDADRDAVFGRRAQNLGLAGIDRGRCAERAEAR